ncbi:hypothetical protein E2C01_029052 [Portunus trituberculatus]|uniref:Uncharacterized protein n=1 Tax=Portunus trituberculatus TaxID=210409 RepID=A0A5B7EQZ0_PORTR|nr:hypothetical protein [Portunus trituberculatus]
MKHLGKDQTLLAISGTPLSSPFGRRWRSCRQTYRFPEYCSLNGSDKSKPFRFTLGFDMD